LLRKKALVLLVPFPKKNSNNEKSRDTNRDKELAICLFAAVVHYLTLITHISNSYCGTWLPWWVETESQRHRGAVWVWVWICRMMVQI